MQVPVYPDSTLDFDIPDGVKWDMAAGYAMKPDHPEYYYDPTSGNLVDFETGKHYDLDLNEIA